MKEKTLSDYPVFETRSDWHNAFLLNLSIILLCVYLSALFLSSTILGIAIAIPLVVYTISSGYYSIKRCPKESIALEGSGLIYSLILIVLLSILSCQLIDLPWYCFIILFSSVILVGRPPKSKDDSVISASSLADTLSLNEESVTPEVQSFQSTEEDDTKLETGIILGFLDCYSDKFVLIKESNQKVSVNFADESIITIERENNLYIVNLFYLDGGSSVFIPLGVALSNYRDILHACGNRIKEQYLDKGKN